MDTENTKNLIRAKADREKNRPTKLEVSNGRLKSENADAAKALTSEVPSVRLAPEQIEEIHTDEYSLTLFYATRIEPMSAAEIKREFPEPEPKKAQAVMDRFVKVGLVHITKEGKYYSNYPENYINYSHYRYDNDLEARKDSKVFRLMKEFTGNREYWKDKTYFSMDAFYSQEQTTELLEMFKQIKLKAKQYANDNAKKKSTKGMRFRRMKFYDMNFAVVLAFFVSCLGMFSGTSAQAAGAGGNDPHGVAAMIQLDPRGHLGLLQFARLAGGNDPTARAAFVSQVQMASFVADADSQPGNPGGGGHDPTDPKAGTPDCNGGHDPNPPKLIDPSECGGGGHDPQDCAACVLEIEGTRIPVRSVKLCRLKRLLDFSARCGQSRYPVCVEADRQIETLLQMIEREEGRAE